MKTKLKILITAIIVLLASCNDPIFYNISNEIKLKEPRIKGSPTKMVELSAGGINAMFVASGRVIYEYTIDAGKEIWKSGRPGGFIRDIAVMTSNIYVLTEESGRNILKRLDLITSDIDEDKWEEVPGSSAYNIRKIYALGSTLYIGAGESEAYQIINYNGTAFNVLNSNTGDNLLNGAAGSYLSTNGGIYNTSGNIIAGTTGIHFVGITGNYAISRDGKLYTIATFAEVASFDGDYLATGALAMSGNLILAGRQEPHKQSMSSGYTYGYLEIDTNNLPSGGSGGFSEPGQLAGTTVPENGVYKTTIGKLPVNYFHSTTFGDNTIFASTQKDGLWSIRERGTGTKHWNAED